MPSVHLARTFLLAALCLSPVGLVGAAHPAVAASESAEHPNLARTAPLATSRLATKRSGIPGTTTLGPNLIANPSLEAVSASDPARPQGWFTGRYGSNDATFSYPVAGSAGAGSRAVRVSMSSRASGDAKWYFDDVPVSGGATYQFSDAVTSSVPTVVTVRYTLADGRELYRDLLAVPATSAFQARSVRFTTPADATALTIFHALAQPGVLTLDDYSLQAVTVAATNLVPNGDLEIASDTGAAPQGWIAGGDGSNTRSLSYPVAGRSGKGMRATISQYDSGHASWRSEALPLAPGLYRFADAYLADRQSSVIVRLRDADQRSAWRFLGRAPPAQAWAETDFGFAVPVGNASVTVYRAIAGQGSLTMDDLRVTARSVFASGAVSLRFDDGLASQYESAAPVLDEYGLPGTFYVVTRETADLGYPAYMAVRDVRDLAARGHEIGAHSRTHPSLSTLSAEQQRPEIAGARQDLLAWGVGPALSFAYPFGDYDATTLALVREAGFTSAAATITGNVSAASDPYQLEYRELTRDTTLEQVRQWVASAAAERRWLILTFHGIDASGSLYACTPAMFRAIVDHVSRQGLPVIPVSQGISSLAP